MNWINRWSITTIFTLIVVANATAGELIREKILFDNGWKFAYGHPFDPSKDFGHGVGYFSYYAKTGFGDGPAAFDFNDTLWRELDLPHDWAVEQPFDQKGSHSHGYKAIGRNFPDASVGWYRKTFFVPETDLGRRISITFDGVSRDSKVWINGHFLGNEPSGYRSFTYDITEYLNYNGNNVVSVRVDVTMEEGWFYEGAGIYRHVWMTKTNQLHVAQYGTFVYSEMSGNNVDLHIETTVKNDSREVAIFSIKQQLFDSSGKLLVETKSNQIKLSGGDELTEKQLLTVENPHLWSIEDPCLHKVVTTIVEEGKETDRYETTTGIRTIQLDANKGFLLNGKHVKLKGTNNHQDHAGVGVAIPDELNYYRISQLKAMGSNAYRSSHNPPTPELLDACDKLGMMVIDENRLMGTTQYVKDQLKSMIVRDRNHPSVFVWSMGNEEWRIEGNIIGERIIQDMQAYANKLDPTRMMNCASSGGWGKGVSKQIEVMGFNYLGHGNTDDYHRDFQNTPSMGTEEGSTHATRGVYFDDTERQHLSAYDRSTSNGMFPSIEYCWNYYNSRPYLAGMFIWTGFDYRGEPTPFAWPSINSYFGMFDVCGFPKDNVWYLKSWWGNEPVLHLLPHWNWKEGEPIKVVAYSNCDEVELFLNNKSQGRKTMLKDSHLEWEVPYKAGALKAFGYKNGKKVMTETVETTGEPVALKLTSHKPRIKADGRDVAIITVSAVDQKGREVLTAENQIEFDIAGPGKIIGVGNGDPTCLEPDKYIEGQVGQNPNINTGVKQFIIPAPQWKRSLFSGKAQVIVQSRTDAGQIRLTARSKGLISSELLIDTE